MVEWWNGGIAPRIINLGNRWRWVVSFVFRQLCLPKIMGVRICEAQFVYRLAMGYVAEKSGFDSRQEQYIFLFSTALTQALGHTPSPIQWVPGSPYLGVMRSGCEFDHPPPSSAEVKNAWSYISTSTRLHVVVLILARRNSFILLFPLNGRMGGPQCRPGRCGEERHSWMPIPRSPDPHPSHYTDWAIPAP
jgi:hypothetical protein